MNLRAERSGQSLAITPSAINFKPGRMVAVRQSRVDSGMASLDPKDMGILRQYEDIEMSDVSITTQDMRNPV